MNEGAFLRFYHQKTNLYKGFKQNSKLFQGFLAKLKLIFIHNMYDL